MTEFVTDNEMAMRFAGDRAPDIFGHLVVAAMLCCRTFPEPEDGRPSDADLSGRMQHNLFYVDHIDTEEWPEDAIALLDACRAAAKMEHPDVSEEILGAAIHCEWPEDLSNRPRTGLN